MAFKKEINWDLVELYVKSGCSQVKIAKSLCIDEDTLRSRVKEKYQMEYSAFSAALISEGEMLLEAAIYQKALKSSSPGNAQILMWLGKVKLGYREPEPLSTPTNQQHLDQSHRIMELEHENAQLKAKDAD
jgi:hypothetical protein